jgi:hypothetical protein
LRSVDFRFNHVKKGLEPLVFWIPILISLFPAARSRTATLLRLHPNYQSLNGLNKVKSSSKTSSPHVTGGVYRAS